MDPPEPSSYVVRDGGRWPAGGEGHGRWHTGANERKRSIEPRHNSITARVALWLLSNKSKREAGNIA